MVICMRMKKRFSDIFEFTDFIKTRECEYSFFNCTALRQIESFEAGSVFETVRLSERFGTGTLWFHVGLTDIAAISVKFKVTI
jgi:hypothetical protein